MHASLSSTSLLGALLALGATSAAAQSVIISEIAPTGTTLTDESGDFEDWVELYNPGSTTVDLNGYSISDDPERPDRYVFPAGVSIPARGFIIIFTDDDKNQGPLHTNFSLKKGGETVLVADASGKVLDRVDFPAVPFRASYARRVGGSYGLSGKPSPGKGNFDGDAYHAPPTASVASGSYSGNVTVTLTPEVAGGAIYYTTDGSEPTRFSRRYTSPVVLSESAPLRAISSAANFADSRSDTWTYLINDAPQAGMSVMMLTVDPVDFTSDERGIYVVGTNGVARLCADPDKPANFWQDWEVPANFQMILPDGSIAFDVDGGTEIQGVCSRRNAQKSLAITLREKTYGDNAIKYDLYPERSSKVNYERLKLRAGGQDWQRILMRDMVNHQLLVDQLDIDVQLGRPLVLYVNGDFYGIYNLREKYRPDYFVENYGADKDDLLIIKNPGTPYQEVKYGPDSLTGERARETDFNDVYDFVETADLRDNAQFERFADNVDVDEFLNYWTTMTYLTGRDWPGNNLTVWRDLGDKKSKWRWAVVDTDVSSGTELTADAAATFNNLNDVLDPNCPFQASCRSEATLFLRKALERPEFRDEFIQRFNTLIETAYAPERAASLINQYAANYLPYTARMVAKWPRTDGPGPIGGDASRFEGYLENFRSFYRDRPVNMRRFLADRFNLGDTYTLTIGNSDNGGVAFHTEQRAIADGFSGDYFQSVPLRIEAVPEEGYAFVRWQETGEQDPVLMLTSNTNITRTPIFDRTSSTSQQAVASFGVSPNPTSDVLRIRSRSELSNDVSTYRIFNTVGAEVTSVRVAADGNTELSVIDLAAGIYVIKRDGEPGGVTFVKR